MWKNLVSGFLLLIATSSQAIPPPFTFGRLTCESIVNPLGIDTKKPRFAWILESNLRNQFQSAFEIIVTENLKQAQSAKGTAWNSAKIISSQNTQIYYAGQPLRSNTRYYWRVRVYDSKNSASDWSPVAWFETAMFYSSDWKAKWIGDERLNPKKDEDYYQQDRMPLFRKQFGVDKKIVSARLYISGLGYDEAYLNGKKIGDHMLDPGFTTYRKEVLYSVYDIGTLLTTGKNTIGIMLGSGWWNPLPFKFFGRWDLRKYQQTGRPCVKAEIHIIYANGAHSEIFTDESWQTAEGPVIHNNVYLGETYDARLEQQGWNTNTEAKPEWKNATLVDGPSGMLSVQMQPPVRITKTIKPVNISEHGKDTFIVDMGQNFAGVVRIKLRGKAGERIAMRYGEDLFKDGRINLMTTVATQIKKGVLSGGPGAPETAWQEDDYFLKGNGLETWSPRFTFHGFRYVEITGWPGKPTLGDIEGQRMNSDVRQVGSFSCSDEQFNKLHEAIQWTFLSNIFSLQSDCPGREKMGYGGDIVATANAFMYNYDMSTFYRKVVNDFANEQRPEGGITEIAPFTGIADRGYGDDSGPLGWELAFPYAQKMLYDFYGDKTVIEENYEAFQRQMNFLQAKSYQGLFHWDISDHEALDPRPEAFTASAFYYHHAKLAAEFAGILGKNDDSIHYTKLASTIRSAIVRKYLIPGTGRFDNATQSAQIFALWYDLSPENAKTWEVLLGEFARHDWHLSTGIFSTKMMFDLFRQNDKNEMAFKIAHQEDYPGWLNMLNHGATTLWETWAYPELFPSQNHPMFGSIDEWFYRSLLGINSAAPGFETVIIQPQPVAALNWAKGSFETPRGKVISDWKKENGKFILHVIIPVNTKAIIRIPSTVESPVKENGVEVNSRFDNGYRVIETGSGEYRYVANSN